MSDLLLGNPFRSLVRIMQVQYEMTRTISLLTAYGEVLESEQVPASDYAAALRRFYQRATQRANAVVILDGLTITRQSFLEFVREFNQSAARTTQSP